MRLAFAVIFTVAAAGCATTQPASPSWPMSPWYCNPCPMPCVHDPTCGAGKVAAAPAPAPPPAPAPAPAPRAAGVSFDPPGGTYSSPQTVTLSTTTHGAAIHYTTDGSEPTASSPVYSGPIAVGSDQTVKAMAAAPGMETGEVSSAEYAIRPPPPARAAIAKGKIELKEKVFFDTGRTTIKPESHALLDDVAAVLGDHPEVKRVVIEGHTDNRGSAAANKKLSQGRAEAVRAYLVDKGVAADRLEAKGFGQTRPIADNKTAKGREANRRVEFTIAP